MFGWIASNYDVQKFLNTLNSQNQNGWPSHKTKKSVFLRSLLVFIKCCKQ